MPRGRPKEFVREEALAKALDAFWTGGYAGTALSDLTHAMGIGRQSLYDTFGDKKGLFLEALAAYCDQQYAAMHAVLHAPEGTPGDRLAAFFEAWSQMPDGEAGRGCLVLKSVAGGQSTDDPEILATAGAQMERIESMIEAAIQAAIDSGEIDCGLSTAEVAAICRNAGQGLALKATLGDVSEEARIVSQGLRTLLGLQVARPKAIRTDSWK